MRPFSRICFLFLVAAASPGHAVEPPIGQVKLAKTSYLRGGNATAPDLLAVVLHAEEVADSLHAACQNLGCASLGIKQQAEELKQIRAPIQNLFQPLGRLFGEVVAALAKLQKLNTLLPVVANSLKVATKIPKVGVVFILPEKTATVFKGVVSNLKKLLQPVMTAVVTPYHKVVVSTLGWLERLENSLIESSSSITGFEGAMQTKCVKELISMAVPSFDVAYNGLESVVVEMNDLLAGLMQLFDSLVTALDTSAWKKVKKVLQDVVDGISVIYTPFKKLEPLTNLLNTPIPLKTLVFRDRDDAGLPDSCPDGYSKKGLECVENCPQGYKAKTLFQCQQKCPDGYPSDGFSGCINNKKKRDTKTLNSKFKCSGSNWEKKGALCYRKCDEGWRPFKHLGVVLKCHKQCPAEMKGADGFTGDCVCKTKSRDHTSWKCKSGYKSVAGVCLEKCTNGEEVAFWCATWKTKNIKISDIGKEFDNLMEKIEGLPIVKEVEKFIENAVNEALEPVLKHLGLPSPGALPALDQVEDILPMSKLSKALETFDPTNALDAFDFNIVDDFVSAFSSIGKADISAIAACAMDANCIVNQFGLPFPENFFSDINDIVETGLSSVSGKMVTLLEGFKGCGQMMTLKFPITEKLAALLNVEGSHASCTFDVDVCSTFNVDQGLLDSSMEEMGKLIEPDLQKIAEKIGKNKNILGSQKTFEIDENNFSVSMFTFNVLNNAPTWKSFQKFKELGTVFSSKVWSASWKWDTYVALFGGLRGGKPFLRLEFHVGVLIGFNYIKDDLSKALFDAVRNLEGTVKDISKKIFDRCMISLDPVPGAPKDTCNQDNPACTKVCVPWEKYRDPNKWAWEGKKYGTAGYEGIVLFSKYPAAYWQSAEGFRRAKQLLRFTSQAQKELDRGLQEYEAKTGQDRFKVAFNYASSNLKKFFEPKLEVQLQAKSDAPDAMANARVRFYLWNNEEILEKSRNDIYVDAKVTYGGADMFTNQEIHSNTGTLYSLALGSSGVSRAATNPNLRRYFQIFVEPFGADVKLYEWTKPSSEHLGLWGNSTVFSTSGY